MSGLAPALDRYQLRLPGFEGPLDVLLRLIERDELDITAISLAAVADQFLAHLAALPDRDPAVLAEFAVIASRLLVLKTRVLFPRPPATPDPDAPDDDADDLVRQLQEYRRLKEAAGALAARDAGGLRAYEPLAAPPPESFTAEVTLAPAGPADLVRAVHRRLARLPATPRLLALVPRVSVGEMAARLAERLRARGELRFRALVRPPQPRDEVVTTFMAILELVRRRRAEAHQETPFGEIVVRPLAAADEPAREVADD
ncbi:MAG TPA: ScpA family protein [Thermomicrobiales bacterium]|nr:ScpA family protein [Thermomicrobiales bacterium]